MEKMREEFEAWYGEQFKYSDKKLTRHGETYLSPFVGGLWSAWKASRSALCVKLPDSVDFYGDLFIRDGGVIQALDESGV